jgi:hypothetical protein
MKTHVRPGARKIFGAQPSSLHEHSGLLRASTRHRNSARHHG